HVEEDAIALRAQQQRNVLVSTVAADAKRIDGPGRECLAAAVEGAKMLAQPEERLLGPEPGRQPAQAASVPGREMVVAAADVAIAARPQAAHRDNGSGVPRGKVTRRPGRPRCYQPRWIHSSR